MILKFKPRKKYEITIFSTYKKVIWMILNDGWWPGSPQPENKEVKLNIVFIKSQVHHK